MTDIVTCEAEVDPVANTQIHLVTEKELTITDAYLYALFAKLTKQDNTKVL